MTEELLPGLGSGALREALGELLGKFERHATYRLISQDETELTGNFRWLPTEKLFIEDVRYQEMLALLSLSSLIESPRHELADADAVECKNCGLGIGYWPTQPECQPAPTSQASSEIRGQAESILGLVLLKLGFTTDHLTDGQLDRARDIIADALASRQGAGGK